MGSNEKHKKKDEILKVETEETSKPPIELYLVRLSPPCRSVWLYMLQVCIYIYTVEESKSRKQSET